MPVSWKLNTDNLGIFTVTGKLASDELKQAQNQAEKIIKQLGGIKILIVLDEFLGWKKDQHWDDFSFGERNDQYINKIAIVGDKKWEDLIYAFTLKGLRPFPIEYFSEADLSLAKEWLIKE